MGPNTKDPMYEIGIFHQVRYSGRVTWKGMHVRLECNAKVCGGHYDDSRVISTIPRVTRST